MYAKLGREIDRYHGRKNIYRERKIERVIVRKRYTVDENIISIIKIRNNFCYPLKMIIFPTLR